MRPPKATPPLEVTAIPCGSSVELVPATAAQLFAWFTALFATKISLPPYVAVAVQPPLERVPPKVPERYVSPLPSTKICKTSVC